MKKQSKTEKNREALLNAAIEIIREEGADKLTVQNICERAGVSNGSFYYLFKSKDDLISYYLSYSFDNYISVGQALIQDYTYKDQMISLYSLYAKCCVEVGSEFIGLFYNVNNRILDYKNRSKDQGVVLGSIEALLRKGIDSGEFLSDIDVDEALLHIASIVTGILFYWCVFNGENVDPEKEIKILLDKYLTTLEVGSK